MANELNYYGTLDQTGLTVVARIYDSTGTQVGSDIPCSEAGSLAIYVGDVPFGTPAGQYGIRFFSGTTLLGQGTLEWSGTVENIRLLDINISSRLSSTTAAGYDTVQQLLHSNTQAAIANLNNFDPATESVTLANNSITSSTVATGAFNNSNFTTGYFNSINSEVDTALADYDAPTKAELDTAQAALIAEHGTTQTAIANLNNLSASDILAQLNAYDAPTKAELDAAQAAIISAVNSGSITVAEVWDYLQSETTISGSMKEAIEITLKNAKLIPAAL